MRLPDHPIASADWKQSWLDAYPCDMPSSVPYPRAPLYELLRHSAARYPEQPACTLYGKVTTYAYALRHMSASGLGITTYLVPPITHQTKTKERKQILERFHRGDYTIVVTSQVLNEGVDVPAAAIGIVLSGTGSTRENVQRLGRILRKHGDKSAILYEVVARGTGEEMTSDRRRQHGAFE